MGSLFVQVGQCGCQIGAKLNPLLSNSYYCTRNRTHNRIHSIMIDTQPKVLKPFLQKPPKWLDPQNVKYFEHGRGNNWSYGFMHSLPEQKHNEEHIKNHKQFSHNEGNIQKIQKYLTENKRIAQFTLDRVRKQLQTVDCALAINVIGSLGGGTGSGLGTKLIQLLSQQFNIDIFAHLVLPNMSGQTPLQQYNCSLSLSKIQEYSNAIFTIQNDKYLQYFTQNTNQEYFLTHSLQDINLQIASSLSKMIKINDLSKYNRFYTDIVSEKIVSNEMKYLVLLASQESPKKVSNLQAQPWRDCMEDLFKQCKIYNQSFTSYNGGSLKNKISEQMLLKRQKLLEGQLITIGSEQYPNQYEKKYEKKLKNIVNPLNQEQSLKYTHIYTSKGTHGDYLISQEHQKIKGKQPKEIEKNEAVLLMNHSNIVRYLSYLVRNGRQKYQSKAYLWHYQYVDLQQAFQNLQKVVYQYNFFVHEGNI